MYQVFCDNKLIIDSRIDELAVVNPIVDVGANIAGSFTFTFPSVHPFIDEINRLTSVIRVERDEEIIFQGFCSSDSVDIFGNRKITCEGDLSYLNDSILRPARYQGETVLSLLTKYINQHNAQVEARKQFEIGNVTVTDPNDYIYCYTNMNSTMQEIKEDLIDDYGGYMRVRYDNGHQYIDYLATPAKAASQAIELGKNIVDYSSNIDESSLATRVIPLGAQLEEQAIEGLDTRLDIKAANGGIDYLESQTAIDNFGIITKTVIFDDVNTPSILKTKGQQWLNEVQFERVVISIKAIDLGLLTDSIDKLDLLDSVHIISEKHGMDAWFPLTSIKYNLNSPEKDTLTFGQSVVKSLSAKTTQLSTATYNLREEINESSWLIKAKDEATALLNGVDGGYVIFHVDEATGKPYEILIMDTDDIDTATKVWRWNKNGLGYFPNGLSGSVSIAMTMNGEINADFIKAGKIRGIEFDATGTVKRYRSDYSNSDKTRIQNIIVGSVVPTSADYEKYDLNSDGIIDIGDLALVTRLINGNFGSYYELSCPVNLNGSNMFGKIKTTDVSIHNKGIVTTCFNVKDTIMFDASATYSSGLPSLSIEVRDNNNSLGAGSGYTWSGITGNYAGLKILNGIVVGTY